MQCNAASACLHLRVRICQRDMEALRGTADVMLCARMQFSRRQGGHAASQCPHVWSACCRKQALYPALQPLLQDASWARWDATLSRMAYSTEAMDAFLASYQAWQTRVDAKRVLRAEQRTADMAAVAEPGATAHRSGEHENGHRWRLGQGEMHAQVGVQTGESG